MYANSTRTIDLSQDTVDLVSTGWKALVLTKDMFSGDRNKWLNDNSSISFIHEYVVSKHSQWKLHWKRRFGKYSRLLRSINHILGKVYWDIVIMPPIRGWDSHASGYFYQGDLNQLLPKMSLGMFSEYNVRMHSALMACYQIRTTMSTMLFQHCSVIIAVITCYQVETC